MKRGIVPKDFERIALRVCYTTVVVNIILTVFKLLTGFFQFSGAMMSDGLHSASDLVSTIILIAAIKMSSQSGDSKYNYGYEKMHSIAALLLSVLLLVSGVWIGLGAINKISNSSTDMIEPGALALIAAAISIIVKEWMYWYTLNAAKKINSTAMHADAWHHRTDALSSVVSLIGIAGARMGYYLLDPLVSIVICIIILKVALDISRNAVLELVDVAGGPALFEMLRHECMQINGVYAVDSLRTRRFSSQYYADALISVRPGITVDEGYAICSQVKTRIEELDLIKGCTVEIKPS